MPVKFRLPVGRIVSGSPTFVQTKDYYGKPKEKPNVFLAVAVPKQDCNEVMGLMFQEAAAYYQTDQRIMSQIQAGLNGKFAWKIDDGDTPDNAKKEGYFGCYIFKFSTSLGYPSCFDRDNRPMDPALIKRGYYVEMFVTAAPNELHDQNAGLFLNPDMIRFVAYGPEIASGPSAEEAFGAAPPPVPPGGSLTPFGPSAAGGGGGGNRSDPFAAVQTGALGPQQSQAAQQQSQAAQQQSQAAPVGFQHAAAAPAVQGQQPQAPAASAVAGSQTGTAFPGSTAAAYPGAGHVFPGRR